MIPTNERSLFSYVKTLKDVYTFLKRQKLHPKDLESKNLMQRGLRDSGTIGRRWSSIGIKVTCSTKNKFTAWWWRTGVRDAVREGTEAFRKWMKTGRETL